MNTTSPPHFSRYSRTLRMISALLLSIFLWQNSFGLNPEADACCECLTITVNGSTIDGDNVDVGFVGNDGVNGLDKFGLDPSKTEEKKANCTITIRADHLFNNNTGNLNHLTNDLPKSPEHDEFLYVGCGANGLNDKANKLGKGVPDAPRNKNQGSEDDLTESHWHQLKENKAEAKDFLDLLPYGESAKALDDALAAAKKHAPSKSDCCKVITIKVVCHKEFEDIEKVIRDKANPKQDSLCGKSFKYDSEKKSWSNDN